MKLLMENVKRFFLLLSFFSLSSLLFCQKEPAKKLSQRLVHYNFLQFTRSMYSCQKQEQNYEHILKNNTEECEHITWYTKKYNYLLKNIDSLWSIQPKIPKIIHQIWLGSKPLPEKCKKLRKSWIQKNPGWVYKLWTDDDIEALDLVNKEFYYKTTSWAEKSNILRYELLYRFGGLYIDTDCECLNSVDFLHHCCDFYAGLEYPLSTYNKLLVGNAVIASKPNHPIMHALVTRIKNSWLLFQPWNRINQLERTGTRYFSRIVKEVIKVCEGNNIIFPTNIFYPWGYEKDKVPVESLAIHYWDALWLKDYKGSLLEFEGSRYVLPLFSDAMICNSSDGENYKKLKKNLFFKFLETQYNDYIVHKMHLAKEERIPKIIHQIWVGPYNPPKEFETWKKSWLKHHPDWTYILWTEKNIKKLKLYNKKYIEEEKNFGAKADLLRYEIIYQFGGLYIDVDFECLKPFDFLHYTTDFYASCFELSRLRETVRFPNGIFAAKKNHPLVKQLILEVKNFRNEKDLLQRVGPNYFTAIVQKILPLVDGINVILPSNFLFSWSKGALYLKPETLAIHHYTGSWGKEYIQQQESLGLHALQNTNSFETISENY